MSDVTAPSAVDRIVARLERLPASRNAANRRLPRAPALCNVAAKSAQIGHCHEGHHQEED
jgi:hypothetical protein